MIFARFAALIGLFIAKDSIGKKARARIGEMSKSSIPLKILADFLAEEGRGLIRPRADDD